MSQETMPPKAALASKRFLVSVLAIFVTGLLVKYPNAMVAIPTVGLIASAYNHYEAGVDRARAASRVTRILSAAAGVVTEVINEVEQAQQREQQSTPDEAATTTLPTGAVIPAWRANAAQQNQTTPVS